MRTILAAILVTTALSAGAASAQPQPETYLPGRALSLAEASAEARAIVVVELRAQGSADIGPPGASTYQSAQARVDEVLRGALRGELTFYYHVQSIPPEHAETAPQPSQRYIVFFARDPGGNHHAIKMLRATEPNLAAVRAMLRR